jgi:hypothetical protein
VPESDDETTKEKKTKKNSIYVKTMPKEEKKDAYG